MSNTRCKKKSVMNLDGGASVASFAGILMVCLSVVLLAAGCKTTGSTQSVQPSDHNKRIEYVKAGSLNLRGGPSIRFPVLGTLKKGERVVIEDRDGNWIKVRKVSGNAKGWVYGAYLTGFSIAPPKKSKPAEKQISTEESAPATPSPETEQLSSKETTPVDDAAPEDDASEIGGKITTIAEEAPTPTQTSEPPDELDSLSPKVTQPIE